MNSVTQQRDVEVDQKAQLPTTPSMAAPMVASVISLMIILGL
jgi:hypothetical protein